MTPKATSKESAEYTNLREWVATTLGVWLEPDGLEATDYVIDEFTQILEARAQEIADGLRKEAAAIYRGFENTSLNGVICSIPDEGLSTRPHRTWCAACQKRWRRLKALGEIVGPNVSDPGAATGGGRGSEAGLNDHCRSRS